MEDGTVYAKSDTKGMVFGNILLGGVVGAGVDIATGAAYDYPEVIAVEMGKTLSQALRLASTPNTDPNSVAARQSPFFNPIVVPTTTGSKK
jgi:hypothetical protein